MDEIRYERRRLINSAVIPLLFLFLAYLLKVSEVIFRIDLSYLGVHPLKWEGIPGILLSALLHGDFAHLFANTLPLFFLGAGLFYYYRDLGLRVFLLAWVLSGLLLWVFARSSVHIGASGLIYALAAFHLVSALLRRNRFLTGFALIVVFLYGGLIWGVFPAFDLKGNISEEAHLMGLVAGAFLAWWYRREQLPWIEEERDQEWEEDDSDDEEEPGEAGDPAQISEKAKAVRINYTLRK